MELDCRNFETKAVHGSSNFENRTNPLMKITDIRKVSKITKKNDILLIVDNTFMTPYYQKPLNLGADVVLHSGTKFLGGHNDTLAGFRFWFYDILLYRQ